MIFPSLAIRRLQQFIAIDEASRTVTYSRACTVEAGGWMLVRVRIRRGKEDRSSLSECERRFVEQNITPAEFRAADEQK